jgi:hypothetical protein
MGFVQRSRLSRQPVRSWNGGQAGSPGKVGRLKVASFGFCRARDASLVGHLCEQVPCRFAERPSGPPAVFDVHSRMVSCALRTVLED